MTDRRYAGGRVFSEDEPPPIAGDAPRRLRFPCFADGCPMAGTMFPGTSRQGVCPWHYAAAPNDIPRITQRLRDWFCVAQEVDAARQILCGPHAADARAQDAALAHGWARLQAVCSGWEADLAPRKREQLHDWSRRLEAFIGARVLETLSPRRAA
jgi:hypothetical protein